MPRFFIEGAPGERYYLGGENGRHAVKSLRVAPGEEVILCDGQGTDYSCTVESADAEGAWLQILSAQPSEGEPQVKITLCQCLPKGDKLETVVQKSVELGVAEILPVESRFCISKMDEKAALKKIPRLQKIALEAAKQSGRGAVPQVLFPMPLKKALEWASSQGDVFFFYEKGRESLRKALAGSGNRLFLFVGPEGGFSPEEAQAAQALGAPLLTLGPRILRTETAPLAALTAILYEKGELS